MERRADKVLNTRDAAAFGVELHGMETAWKEQGAA
jgi:hypothetical protein